MKFGFMSVFVRLSHDQVAARLFMRSLWSWQPLANFARTTIRVKAHFLHSKSDRHGIAIPNPESDTSHAV